MAGVKQKHYRHPGGVIALPRAMVTSPQWRALSGDARALIIELQAMWRPGTVTYSLDVQRAGTMIGKSASTGSRVLKRLAAAQFIVVAGESNWINGQSRDFRCTWQSHNGREPTNEWASVPAPEKKSTVSPVKRSRRKRLTSETVEGSVPDNRLTSETVETKHQALTGAGTAPTVSPVQHHK